MDINQFYESMRRADTSAYMATPALYTFLDKLFYEGDSFQNSAGIATNQAITETYALKLADMFSGREAGVQAKIKGILMGSMGITDPFAQMYAKNAQKEQIKNVLEAEKNKREAMARMLAENKAFSQLEKAKTKQLNQMYASELASSQGTSDDKQNSMNEISGAYLMGAKDIATA